jgi:hypothetical protein
MESKRAAIKYLPEWFIALFALVYVTGYLVDIFFFSSLGITDAGAEVLKLQYIETGLVFFIAYR